MKNRAVADRADGDEKWDSGRLGRRREPRGKQKMRADIVMRAGIVRNRQTKVREAAQAKKFGG